VVSGGLRTTLMLDVSPLELTGKDAEYALDGWASRSTNAIPPETHNRRQGERHTCRHPLATTQGFRETDEYYCPADKLGGTAHRTTKQ